jgi:hypothetical protein
MASRPVSSPCSPLKPHEHCPSYRLHSCWVLVWIPISVVHFKLCWQLSRASPACICKCPQIPPTNQFWNHTAKQLHPWPTSLVPILCRFLVAMTNTWEKNLKGGKTHFGSWFQSMAFGFTASGPSLRQNLTEAGPGAEVLMSWQGMERRRQEGKGRGPDSLHLLLLPSLPTNAIKLWTHQWTDPSISQSSQDPITSPKPISWQPNHQTMSLAFLSSPLHFCHLLSDLRENFFLPLPFLHHICKLLMISITV